MLYIGPFIIFYLNDKPILRRTKIRSCPNKQCPLHKQVSDRSYCKKCSSSIMPIDLFLKEIEAVEEIIERMNNLDKLKNKFSAPNKIKRNNQEQIFICSEAKDYILISETNNTFIKTLPNLSQYETIYKFKKEFKESLDILEVSYDIKYGLINF